MSEEQSQDNLGNGKRSINVLVIVQTNDHAKCPPLNHSPRIIAPSVVLMKLTTTMNVKHVGMPIMANIDM